MGAPKRSKLAKGNRRGGRPTLYKPTYAEIARRMCAQGATRADLADRFGVTIDTIVAWQSEHRVFSASCKLGQEAGDNHIKQSFYERAIGYTYDCEKLLVVQGEVIREPIKERVPPDTRAAEFWLRNRWKDTKQSEARTADDDPLLAFLKSIDGRVLRPVDPAESAIEIGCVEVKPEPGDDDGPPRPIAGPKE